MGVKITPARFIIKFDLKENISMKRFTKIRYGNVFMINKWRDLKNRFLGSIKFILEDELCAAG